MIQMSEKVLGVPIKWSKCFGTNNGIRYEIAVYESELVFVRLASESVDLKWLENYCKMNGYPFHDEDVVSVQDLLEAVRLQAEKEAKKK